MPGAAVPFCTLDTFLIWPLGGRRQQGRRGIPDARNVTGNTSSAPRNRGAAERTASRPFTDANLGAPAFVLKIVWASSPNLRPFHFAEDSACCFSQSASLSAEIASSFFFFRSALSADRSLSVILR